jgi:hypothetical protein
LKRAPLLAGGAKDEVFVLERARFERPLTAVHDDFGMVDPIVAALVRQGGGWESFARKTTGLIRRAIDEVIDTARTNRFLLKDTEKTEKTYLGTKIEILFRAMLALQKGRNLDLSVDGADVDVKNTMGSNWSIPEEALGHACVLIRESERSALCSVGVIVAMDAYLNPGRNRDRKRTFSVAGLQNAWWILHDVPYPPNIWEILTDDQRDVIMAGRGGTERLAVLFQMLQDRPLQRSVVEHVAQQKDPMKRIRRNGGARDLLAPTGVAILYGRKDRKTIAILGLPELEGDEFIAHTVRDEAERRLLRAAGHID